MNSNPDLEKQFVIQRDRAEEFAKQVALWKRSMCVLYEMLENTECPNPEAAIGLTTSALVKLQEQVAEQQREIEDFQRRFDDLEHGRGNFDFVQRTNHTINRLRDKLAERDSTIQRLRMLLRGAACLVPKAF